MIKPFKHQLDALDFLKDKHYGALFMEQGTGKTKVAICSAVQEYENGSIEAVLVIAPNGVHKQWVVEQLPLHCDIEYKAHYWQSSNNTKAYERALGDILYGKGTMLKWLVVNVEAFSYPTYMAMFKEFVITHRTMIIIDECTAIKNPEAKRTANILRGFAECKWRGKSLTSCVPISVKRLILTGTPVTNGPFDLWSMFEFLNPGYFGRPYVSFKKHYSVEKKQVIQQGSTERIISILVSADDIKAIRNNPNKINACIEYGITEKNYDYIMAHPEMETPYKYMEELKASIEPYSFFIKKDECLDLEPKIYKRRIIPMSKEQARLYLDLETEYITTYNDMELTITNKVTLYTRLSQICGGFLPYMDEDTGVYVPTAIDGGNPKADALLEDLQLCDYPAIVVTRFTAEANYLYERIKKAFSHINVGIYTGSNKHPKDVIECYKQGYVQILIANEKMISKGHNLQNGHNIFFFSNSYSLEDREQTEDRIHRQGQLDKCLFVDYIMEGSIDMKVHSSLKNKKKLLDYMRDKSVKEFLTVVDDDMQREFEGWL